MTDSNVCLIPVNKQRLKSAGEFIASNRRSKRSCSNAGSLRNFHVIEGTWGSNTRDQSLFFAFHSFLVEVQANAGDIHATRA